MITVLPGVSAEINVLKSYFDKYLHGLLAEHQVKLAGGALTSVFTQAQVNDLDLYFRDKRSMLLVMDALIGEFGFVCILVTDKSATFVNGDQVYQCVCTDTYETADSIFQDFDFSVNMACYDFKTETVQASRRFMADLAARRLAVEGRTKFPIISLIRTEKYRERGFSMSTKEYTKLALLINELSLNSWEDLEKHLAGMYGQKVTEFLKKDEPFSISAALGCLDELQTSIYQQQEFDYCSIEDVAEKLNMVDLWETIVKEPAPPRLIDNDKILF